MKDFFKKIFKRRDKTKPISVYKLAFEWWFAVGASLMILYFILYFAFKFGLKWEVLTFLNSIGF